MHNQKTSPTTEQTRNFSEKSVNNITEELNINI